MAAEPIPVWARVVAVVAGTATALIAIPIVVLGAVALASTVATVSRTTTYDVGPAPRLQVDSRFASVAIEAARDARIVVHDKRSAGSVSRVAAAAALQQLAVDVSRQGDLVLVRQPAARFVAPTIGPSSTITIEVPAHTDVDASDVGDLRLQGIDGTVHVHGSGSVVLTDATLRGGSRLEASFGEIRLTGVTVAGGTALSMGVGGVWFDGRLEPGGSALDVQDDAGDVHVILPQPTDARAVVASDAGDFHPDGTWLFAPDAAAPARRWTADLAPSPTGMVTVRARLGGISFGSR